MSPGPRPLLGKLGREADGLGHVRRSHRCREGDAPDGAGGEVHGRKAALEPQDDATPVGVPIQARIGAVCLSRVLPVAVEAVQEDPFLPRRHVAHHEDRALQPPVHVGEKVAVRGQRRLEGTTGPLDDDLRRARRLVERLDAGAPGRNHVWVEAERVRGLVVMLEQEAAATRHQPGAVHRPVSDDQGFAFSVAIGAERYQLARYPVPGHTGVDPLAVARPGGPVDVGARPVGGRPHLARPPFQHPDLVASAAVGREGDALPIGAVAGRQVPGASRGQGDGVSSHDRHLVDRAEEVEDDLPAIGRDIHAHPGAFGGVEAEWANGSGGGLDGPSGLLGVGGGVGQGRHQGQQHAGARQEPKGSTWGHGTTSWGFHRCVSLQALILLNRWGDQGDWICHPR